MFVKRCASKSKNNTHETFHIVESYRKEDGTPSHRYLANITPLPDPIIRHIKQLLKHEDEIHELDDIRQLLSSETSAQIDLGDSLGGAGLLALRRAWQKSGMNRALNILSEAQKQSTFAMVAGRVLDPCSKRALKTKLKDTLLQRAYSKNRLEEDTLYEVMDELEEEFETIQQRLRDTRDDSPVLLLYDTTSTYFEGRKAEPGEYGHSKDKRWDRHQIIVGLVCGQDGLPLAVEIWPGNTHDSQTLQQRIDLLREKFGVENAVWVSDEGMYSESNLETITDSGYDYIVGLEWHRQRERLVELAPGQLELFDERGHYEWTEGETRYVGCHSPARKTRAQKRRKQAMKEVEKQLEEWQNTAQNGKYYHENRLYQKVHNLLDEKGVNDLYEIEITALGDETDAQAKTYLDLSFQVDEGKLKRRKALEGKYVLETSLDSEKTTCQDVEAYYKRLQKVERAFRHLKSFLSIRPIYHYKKSRIRAHVLICFLAYYLVAYLEKEFRDAGETREVEAILEEWDQLRVSQVTLRENGDQLKQEWKWGLGQEGQKIRKQIKDLGWWRSIQAHKRSLLSQIDESP